MKLETFFEKFDLFADAPDAVGKMRELVLELAVQGELVDQDPDEGDGFELLSRIHQGRPPAKARETEDAVDVYRTSLPSSWALSELGDVAVIIRGVTFPGSAKFVTRSGGDVACLRTASVQLEIDWDDMIYISPNHVSRSDQWVAPNDIMISMANSYALVGKVAIVREVPQRTTFGAFLAAIRPVLIEPYFLLYVLRSPRMQAAFRASSSQTTNIANISLGRMRPLPFPLPPLAEQKRIVAKVDELMALCDRLEAQQQERETQHATLARASLARFADAPTPANLDLLFHKSYGIPPADLRKSILTLAVRGKLVPQDPNDERPAVTRDGQCDELFEVAGNWEWIQLGDLEPEFQNGASSRGDKDGTPIVVVRLADIESRRIALDAPRAIAIASEQIAKYRLQAGDTLITRVNGSADIVGSFIPVLNALDAIYCDHFIRMRVDPERLLPAYTALVGESQLVRDQIKSLFITTAGQKTVNQSHIRSLSVPLPPLAEQHRIVAKVDELMVLVNALETQLATAHSAGATLMKAAVSELTAAA